MEHSKVDRVPADPRPRNDAVVDEVHVIVTDEGRGTGSVPWRYLASGLAVFAVLAGLLVTSLSSGRGSGHAAVRSRSPAAASRSSAACVHTAGYGGLGGRASAFDANNNNSTGPAGPTPGSAWYVVTGTARGCVTAFSLQEGGAPPASVRDLLFLVSHPYLPGDAKRVAAMGACAVWRSATLRRVTGRAYATATAVAQVGSTPGRAQIEATSKPAC